MASTSDWHTVTVEVPFVSPKHASIAKQVIDVDKELQPQAVKRELTVDGNKLVAKFDTLTVRLARLTVNAFLENVDLVVRTLENFGEDAENPPVTAA
ncbi:hypothetical protein NP233_g3979 [Leucocoprinus birnbaumii]|uniref:Transcription factor Pcc1 n=1 Tax=Leucocoprinus birnbaumii TaxID=56174 RepID=A0AAD5VW18_9AGAR|nr:hypothetical protein NP233_g3979 [Leucocoprinus birnbaumii]